MKEPKNNTNMLYFALFILGYGFVWGLTTAFTIYYESTKKPSESTLPEYDINRRLTRANLQRVNAQRVQAWNEEHM